LDLVHTLELLLRLPDDERRQAGQLLIEHFGGAADPARHGRIALIGLRGAGKSTLGAMLAERLQIPFIELDRMIEEESGMTLCAIFDLWGQSGFRRLERQCLDQTLAQHHRFVLATSGGLVSEPATYERLLASCCTIWLRASPDEHLTRVRAPAGNRAMNQEAMADIERILSAREPLYKKADGVVDTSGRTVEETFELLVAELREASSQRKVLGDSSIEFR
jgi:XRE family transcriptional regulator, aerobic/anaerobic benzoate catabolism transcriptional regulator